MIAGLTFEYAHARISASLSARPVDRLWQQLGAARSIAALLDLLRSSPAAPWVSGIPASGESDVIELALRQQLRARINEVASWAPETWRKAVLYTHQLIALPALMHLITMEAPPAWIAVDPDLCRYALPDRLQRRAEIAAGSLAPLANAIEQAEDTLSRDVHRMQGRSRNPLHRALRAWLRSWQAQWPDVSSDAAAGLVRVAHTLELHVGRFGSLTPKDALAARQALTMALLSFIHRFVAAPAEPFAYLALFALDLERLRWEFMRCAHPVPAAA